MRALPPDRPHLEGDPPPSEDRDLDTTAPTEDGQPDEDSPTECGQSDGLSHNEDQALDTTPGAQTNTLTYSFGCFPVERIILLLGMLAGPFMAGSLVINAIRQAAVFNISLGGLLSRYPHSRLLVGSTFVLSLVLFFYSLMYFQMRERSRLVLDDSGFRFERDALLPFGLLGQRLESRWSEVTRVARKTSVRTLTPKPILVITCQGRTLRLSVADAWEDGAGNRPLLPRKPPDGWFEHPLVAFVEEGWRRARMAAALAER